MGRRGGVEGVVVSDVTRPALAPVLLALRAY
jgi:hypothetical protein